MRHDETVETKAPPALFFRAARLIITFGRRGAHAPGFWRLGRLPSMGLEWTPRILKLL